MSDETERPDGVEPLGPPVDLWSKDKNDREYVKRPDGRRGVIYRMGEETIAQAVDRDAQPKDRRPKRKTKAPPKPPPPKSVDLKALEVELTEAFKSPAMFCALTGDTWAANHFTIAAPNLARNLVNAAEHNPWLRAKLEAMATGQDAAMKIMSLLGVGGALAFYIAPPVIYWFNLPVPEKARAMFEIPDRRADAPAAQPPQAQPVAA